MAVRKIIVCGGGTAGSVAPLLAVVSELRRRDPRIEWLFVGTRDGPERELAEFAGLTFRAIPAGKWRRYWSWRNITDWLGVIRGYFTARMIVRSWKPDVVISAGSYVAVPLVWAAKISGCKILIHQQDVRPGLANRLMVAAANVITVTFESSLRDFPAGRTHFTGNPVRPEIIRGQAAEGRKIFDLKPDIPVLVVTGGSTGSYFLNSIIAAVAYRLVKDWQIVHLTGARRDFVELKDRHYHRYDFLTWEMPHLLAVADVVVSRAGLGMMTELAATAKPTILFPMPQTHQVDNANLLRRLKAAVIFDQDKIKPNEMYEAIDILRLDPDRRRQLSENIHQLYVPDAVERISQLVLKLCPS